MIARFFLDQDNDGHWYLVDASKRAEWAEWLELPNDDARAWEGPKFARQIDRPQDIEFTEPLILGL